MCKTLSELHREGLRLVVDGVVQRRGCLELVRRWAVDERHNINRGFEHKYSMRPMQPRNDRERLMQETENLPIEWRVESALWNKYGGLLDGWEDTYRRLWLKEGTAEQVGAQYELGLQWILDYYLGKPVSYSWYFPWSKDTTMKLSCANDARNSRTSLVDTLNTRNARGVSGFNIW